jgi:hypothetical protein
MGKRQEKYFVAFSTQPPSTKTKRFSGSKRHSMNPTVSKGNYPPMFPTHKHPSPKARQDIRTSLDRSKETRALEQVERISMERTNDNSDKTKIITEVHNSEQEHAQMYSMFRTIYAGNLNPAESQPLKSPIHGPLPAKQAIGVMP